MFHLFKKKYLEYDFLFTSKYPSLLVSNQKVKDPLFSTFSFDSKDFFYEPASFEDTLNEKYNGKIEEFWTFLYNAKKGIKFVLYADKETYCKLQLQYWKSIFQNPTEELCYFLHKISIQNFYLSQLFIKDFTKEWSLKEEDKISCLEPKEFSDLFKSVEPVDFLINLPFEDRSYEYLLANYLCEQKGVCEAFESKLKILCQRLLLCEFDILRGDVIRGIYDEVKASVLEENEKWSFEKDVGHFDSTLKSKERFLWLLDESLASSSIDQIKKKYGKDYFFDIWRRQYAINRLQGTSETTIFEEEIICLLEIIFDERYLEALDFEIKRGYGSMLFNNDFRYDVNTLLVGYFYDLYRSNEAEKLKKFQLRG